MRLQSWAVVALAAAAIAGAACKDQSPSACLEPNAIAYPFWLPGDTSKWFHWPSGKMPLKVYAENVGELQANVDSGTALWTAAMRCGGISFVRVTDSTVADIIVRNPPVLPPPGAPPLMQVRMAADSVGACVGVTQAVVDTTQTTWKLIPPMRSYVSPQSSDTAAITACYHFTVAHELGHAIGLLSHSSDPNDLMYYQPRRRYASPDDRYTLETLYRISPSIILGP